MRKIFIFVCLAGFLATLNLSAFDEEEPGFDVSLKYWHTSGEMRWKTSYPLPPGTGASELVFPQDGSLGILSAEWGTWRKFFVNASLGIGSNSGTSSDSDWAYGVGLPDPLYSLSIQDCTSEPLLWDINLGYRLLDKPELNAEPTFDVFVGYQHERSEFKMTNLYQTISAGPPIPPVGPIAGLNSTYEITYKGPRIGIRGDFKPAPRWTLGGSFAYAWLTTEGKGYWNLRAPVKTFTHSGGKGEGIDTNFGVNYTFARFPDLSLQLDYRYLKMENKGGGCSKEWDPAGIVYWDYAKSTFHGPMLLATYKW